MTLARGRGGKPLATLLGAFLLLAVCAGKKLSPLELRVARLEEQVAALEATRERLLASLDSLEALVAEQTSEVRARRATGEEHVSRLQTSLQALQSDLESLRLDVSELRDRMQFEVGQGASTGGAGAAGGAAASGDSPRALYEAAYQDLSQGKHDLALMGFHEVLSRFPTSELADNAQYWIGEVYYDKQDYPQALEEFLKVEQSFPTGDKVPAALLKIGMTQQQLGKSRSADKTFQSLIQRFPSTEEARLARTKLSSP